MKRLALTLMGFLLSATLGLAQQKTVTIAVVNNPDMVRLKKLSAKFEEKNPDLKLNWVVVEENVLRQRVTTDASQGSGQFDLVYLGLYEAPIFAKRGWVKPIENVPADYDLDDVFKALRDGLSYDGKLYALPFNGESSMLMYRKDLFDAAGITVPAVPDRATYDDIKKWADKLTDKAKGIYGITLRGKPGWGENMAYVGTLLNTFGATWFDMNWKPTIDTDPWKEALTFYVNLMKADGPPGASSNGFNENLTLFGSGKAAMWIDATSGAGPLFDKSQSQVSDKVAFALAPIAKTPNGAQWLWSWALAIPKSSKNPDGALKFALWATSKDYIKMAAADGGWAIIPPGTRKSTYDNEEYLKAAPFAAVTLKAMQTADPTNPAITKVPYIGIQFVGIPEFQAIGTQVGQNVAAALSGKTTVEQTVKTSQIEVQRAMQEAGYYKK